MEDKNEEQIRNEEFLQRGLFPSVSSFLGRSCFQFSRSDFSQRFRSQSVFFRYVYLYIYTGLHALWQDSHSSQIKRKVRIKTSNRARNNGLNAQHTRLMNYNKQSRVSFIADHFNILRVREKKNAMENSQDDFFLFRNFSCDLIGRCISHPILYSDHIILCRKTVYQRIR